MMFSSSSSCSSSQEDKKNTRLCPGAGSGKELQSLMEGICIVCIVHINPFLLSSFFLLPSPFFPGPSPPIFPPLLLNQDETLVHCSLNRLDNAHFTFEVEFENDMYEVGIWNCKVRHHQSRACPIQSLPAEPGFIIQYDAVQAPVTCWCNNLSLPGKRPVQI